MALSINHLSHPVQWHTIRFEFLRKIDLGHAPAKFARYEGSRLIYHLAAHPDAFPLLKKLKLKPYIEWDIFFIMLESRNSLRKTATSSRLKSVVFTSRIPAEFAELTSRLLRGTKDEVDSLSKYEFSWMGSMEIIQDMSL
ncbi:hypothetical protein PIIN_10414 [Serendipita indica DSM 11827]|uniref:Uncharacterized protein n=1 Tax=Serendipita indica (strain DSM 11827) TaxID=1109443 RepID=G4TYM8_SERID|nr:hypothetical protein PIIN_10414 [Serendipita indica DSM 11827]